MNILHIVSTMGDPFSGVHVAVPQHIQAQQKIANVAVVNIKNIPIEGANNQFSYRKSFSIKALPAPFDTPDLVVFHEIYKPEFLSISAQLRAEQIPYVIVPHGSLTKMAQRKKWAKKFVGNVLLFNRYINNAKAIQFLSEKELNISRNKDKGFIGSNGVTLPDVFKKQFHKDEIKMVFVGRKDVYYKGLDLLLSGIALKKRQLEENQAKIHLYGPGDDKDIFMIDKMVEDLQIGHLVKCHNSVCGNEKQEALLCADVFVQTSRSEGMPMGILEALSYGLPCIVTEGTNLGALVRKYDAGWVTGTDAQSIADTMCLMMKEKDLWAVKSVNSVKLIEENFLWSKIAEDVLKEYRRVLDET